MKNLKFLIYIICLIFIVLIALKAYYQYKFNATKLTPCFETKESIKTFAKVFDNAIILMPKDSTCSDFTDIFFNTGCMFVFNSNKLTLANNINNNNGKCFSDMRAEIMKNDTIINSENTLLNSSWPYDSLIKSTVQISGDTNFLTKKYDLIVVFGWTKFETMSYNKKQLDFLKTMQNSKKKILIIAVNNDYSELCWKKFDPIPLIETSYF